MASVSVRLRIERGPNWWEFLKSQAPSSSKTSQVGLRHRETSLRLPQDFTQGGLSSEKPPPCVRCGTMGKHALVFTGICGAALPTVLIKWRRPWVKLGWAHRKMNGWKWMGAVYKCNILSESSGCSVTMSFTNGVQTTDTLWWLKWCHQACVKILRNRMCQHK